MKRDRNIDAASLHFAMTVAKAKPMLEAAQGPNPAQLAALEAFAAQHGRTWKSALSAAWYSGNYKSSEHSAELQQVRNTLGPKWLVRFSLNATRVAVFVRTEPYEVAHAKSPRGEGNWGFWIGSERPPVNLDFSKVFWHAGTYGEARKAAIAVARERARAASQSVASVWVLS